MHSNIKSSLSHEHGQLWTLAWATGAMDKELPHLLLRELEVALAHIDHDGLGGARQPCIAALTSAAAFALRLPPQVCAHRQADALQHQCAQKLVLRVAPNL